MIHSKLSVMLPPVLRLTCRELCVAVWAQLELLYARALVSLRPIGRLIAPVRVRDTSIASHRAVAAEITEIVRAVDRATRRGLFRPRCLARAIALHRMIERRGIRGTVVRIGVKTSGSRLLAHAWVEYRGVTIGEQHSAVAEFSVLTDARLPGAAGALR